MSVAVPILGRALTRTVTPMSGSLFGSLTTPVIRAIFWGTPVPGDADRPMTICRPESFHVLPVPANNCFKTVEMD